jgi:aconitate hydratase
MSHNAFNTAKTFQTGSGEGKLYSLPELAKTFPSVNKLPVSIRIVLESVLRNVDGKKVTEAHVKELATWGATDKRTNEIPFIVSRVVLQDFTGVPLLADLAAMRNVAKAQGKNPKTIEPLVPVDLVVDHSVMTDHTGSKDALDLNMKLEFKRNEERYQFMKWGMQAFDTFKVVPPGIGIVHQVNLEYLAPGVHSKNGLYFPDTIVGTDSHTTMINGIGVVGWGVGGIEAEAGMLGQPVYFLTPDVVGVHLKGKLREGVMATDLVLTITELLRKTKVVGKFVEFFGEGTASLALPDRATIANMAPEYGATMGFFPIDDSTIDYLKSTGRTDVSVAAFENYFKAQGLFGTPKDGDITYSQVVELDLTTIKASLAGPKRPQDRIELPFLGAKFTELFSKPIAENGFAQAPEKLKARHILPSGAEIGNGDVLIAAITSCTNTSNPGVLIAAGLLAKKAVEKGLTVKKHIKTSLAPGSRVVTEYLTNAGLMPYLEQLGFHVAAYGCTTCIGNVGDMAAEVNEGITKNDLICAAVLSGNRNFEARIHPNLKANFLASPPLVVAYAIAGTVIKNVETEAIGVAKDGTNVYLRDIWPTSQEIAALMGFAKDPATFRKLYSNLGADNALWQNIKGTPGDVYDWPKSTYIAKPPFFDGFSMTPPAAAASIMGARALGVFGDSITTDHISPAGSFKDTTPAGKFLLSEGVQKADFNSYGSRRGHHEVMMRGTFANVRVKNLMMPAKADGTREEGGVTVMQPSGEQLPIYDAAMKYVAAKTPTVVFGGEEYGNGSSRDWAAKGTQLLGVKAVIVRSFERIHRSNLVGMGVLPLQFKGTDSAETLGIKGDETFDIVGLDGMKPQQDLTLVIHRKDGTKKEVSVTSRIDTPIEIDYFKHGGILPYVLREQLGGATSVAAAPAAAAIATAAVAGVGAAVAGTAIAGTAAVAASATKVTTPAGATPTAAPVAKPAQASVAHAAGTAAAHGEKAIAAAGMATAAIGSRATGGAAPVSTKRGGIPWWVWLIALALAAWLLKSCFAEKPVIEKKPEVAVVTPAPVAAAPAVVAPAKPSISFGKWFAGLFGPKVTLGGAMKDQGAKDALLGAAKGAFGDNNVLDKLTVDANAGAMSWAGKWPDLFAWMRGPLFQARGGNLAFDGDTLKITGKVDTAEIKADIEAKLRAIVGPDVKIVNELVIEAAKRVAVAVNFDTGSTVIKPAYFSKLNEFAEQLKKDGTKGEVGGHTDNVGQAASNQALSQARADSVKKFLLSKGVAADALSANGYGDAKPVADNATADGKAKNRRIEFTQN